MVCGSLVPKAQIQFMRTAKQMDWQADRCRLYGIQADPQLALTTALQEQVAHADTLHTGQVIRVMPKLKCKPLSSGEYTRSATKKKKTYTEVNCWKMSGFFLNCTAALIRPLPALYVEPTLVADNPGDDQSHTHAESHRHS